MLALLQSIDDSVLYAVVGLRSDMATAVLKVVSVLGEWYVLFPVTAVIAYALWRKGLPRQAWVLLCAVGVVSILVTLVKLLVARARPAEMFRLIAESGYSFPSWHAAMAIAFWGFLAYMAAKHIQNATARISMVTLCLLAIIATDFGRIYLGVHYFSDVLAGTVLGGLVLFISISAIKSKRYSGD